MNMVYQNSDRSQNIHKTTVYEMA